MSSPIGIPGLDLPARSPSSPAIARPALVGLTMALSAALASARIASPQEPKPAAEPAKAPAAGRVLRVRVVSAADGRPVPRADFRLWLRLGRDDWRTADEDGRIEVVYATGPDVRDPNFDVWGDGFAMQRHGFGADPKVPIPDEVTIRLQPGETLGGEVRDEAGGPIAGAIVYLWSHNYKHKDPKELLYDLRAVTGPDGRWRTGGAPETTGELLGIYITHPDYLSDREYVSGRAKPPIADLRAGKAASVMKKGVPIGGRILTADGRPVAGALVISTERPSSLYEDQFTVRSDAEGRFRTGQVRPGEWHLVIRAPGHAPAARQVRVGAAAPDEEFRLEPPHPFRVSVADPGGRPIAGAFVNVEAWRGYRCLGVYLYTDADGLAGWDDAPGDEMSINVHCEGYTSISGEKVRAGAASTFVLRPALRISGIVRDAETKKGVARAEVESGAVDPRTGEVATWQPSPRLGAVWFSQGFLNAHFPIEADAHKIRITAPGYEPFVSRAFRREEKTVVNYDITLVPGRGAGPVATALRPDGRPLAGARVVRNSQRRGISLGDNESRGDPGGRQEVTAADGTFPIPEENPGESGLVVILGDDCFAYANAGALKASPRLPTRPYGRVEGRYLVGGDPARGLQIELSGNLQDDSTRSVPIFFGRKATTDIEGRFVFEKVIPMPALRVARRSPLDAPGQVSSIGESIRVEDGKTTEAIIGGKGRPVVGRVEPPEGWKDPINFADRATVSLESNRPVEPVPVELVRAPGSLRRLEWSLWSHAWRKSPEGRAYEASRVDLSATLNSDGSFRVDDIPPGDYRISIRVNEDEGRRNPGPFASIGRTLTVPPIPGGRSDEPVDVGRLRLRPRVKPEAGAIAPAFEVTTVDGRRLAVPGDFRGKFLLLDFGTMGDQQSIFQVGRMAEVARRFAKDDRLAILSLVADADRAETRAFVVAKKQAWPQAIIGPASSPITDACGVEPGSFPAVGFPAAILIGPDGRIVARDLWNQKIGEAVAAALGGAGP